MKVGIFYNSISNPAKFSNKVNLMDNFKAGVLANGDEVVEFHSNQLPDQRLDAGFVLGYTLEQNFRRRIIDSFNSKKIPLIFVDSNILHYARKEHEWHRYSLNSVYPSDGIYFFGDLDKNKWERKLACVTQIQTSPGRGKRVRKERKLTIYQRQMWKKTG